MGAASQLPRPTCRACAPLLRFYILGIKRDPGLQMTRLSPIAASVVQRLSSKLPTPRPFYDFLKIQVPDIDWTRLHVLPDLRELNNLKPCMCKLNPVIVCPTHGCQCGCHGDGSCAWRQKAIQFMAKRLPHILPDAEDGKLSYIQLLELHNIPCPASARERNLLNIMSYICKPLDRSHSILDLSQSIDRCQMRADGLVPTYATKSKMWPMRLGRELTIGEAAALFGVPPWVKFNNQLPGVVSQFLGNSMHVADIGVVAGLGVLLRAGLLASEVRSE